MHGGRSSDSSSPTISTARKQLNKLRNHTDRLSSLDWFAINRELLSLAPTDLKLGEENLLDEGAGRPLQRTGRRGISGPGPPPSWTQTSAGARLRRAEESRRAIQASLAASDKATELERRLSVLGICGTFVPSLYLTCLDTLARYFDAYAEIAPVSCEASLSDPQKQQLMVLLAQQRLTTPIDGDIACLARALRAVDVLFQNGVCTDIDYIDLSYCHLTPSALSHVLQRNSKLEQHETEVDVVDWEARATGCRDDPRFPNVTRLALCGMDLSGGPSAVAALSNTVPRSLSHLSLAYATGMTSRSLLTLARHLHGLETLDMTGVRFADARVTEANVVVDMLYNLPWSQIWRQLEVLWLPDGQKLVCDPTRDHGRRHKGRAQDLLLHILQQRQADPQFETFDRVRNVAQSNNSHI